jgi:hypothetical protein
MKMLSLTSALLLATTVFSLTARGDEPPVPQAAQLTPQIQAMLAELLKAADADAAPETAPTAPPTAPVPPSAPTTPAAPATTQKAKAAPSTALSTGSLRTGGLTPSGSLGGHGTLGGAPRLTDDEWRQQFPVRK